MTSYLIKSILCSGILILAYHLFLGPNITDDMFGKIKSMVPAKPTPFY
jgi:hypothetical protein